MTSTTPTFDAGVRGKPDSHRLSDRIAIKAMTKALEGISVGQLTVTYAGERWHFGASVRSELKAEMHIHDARFFQRLLMGGSIGVSESYMAAEWDTPDLTKVIQLMAANLSSLNALEGDRPWVGKTAQWLLQMAMRLRHRNTLQQAKENIAAHYDLSNDLFELFLDPTMMYSSAVFASPQSSLEEASEHKVKLLCDKLSLQPDDHLLEIGTGWGYFAIYAARHYGCRVTTTTLSQEQFDYANERVAREGLSDRITILLQDYRELEGCYDKLVSVEMIEAVGHQFFATYFAKCSSLLKPNGLMAIQAITIPDQRYDRAIHSVDFIQKYIFPGGCLPSHEAITYALKHNTDMQMAGFEEIGLHYAETLRHWRHRFTEKLTQVRELGFDERFVRMWEYYFCYCEGGFRERAIGASQWLFAKPDWR